MTSSARILVAYKKSRYTQFVIEDKDQTIIELLEREHISVHTLESSHSAHHRSLDELVGHLERAGIAYDCRYRGDVQDTDDYDLIVAVGGDGTVLDLSHRIDDTPIMAINSDPDTSVGYFSAGTAFDFPRILEKIFTSQEKPIQLCRFHIEIDGKRCGPPVLNDILISHPNPAAVSSYFLQIGARPAEEQKSSGIWVSTPAGSTAAIRSAGGLVLPFDSRDFQYQVREPFPPQQGGYRFIKGLLPESERLEVISRMRHGQIFIDGPHLTFDFPIGTVLTINRDAPSLALFGLQEDRRTA